MESHMGIARQYVLADWPATESRNLTPGKAEGRQPAGNLEFEA